MGPYSVNPSSQRLTNGRRMAEEGTAMKRCAQCQGKLGLGVRSRNLWNGRWWVHVRYCSSRCEARHELDRRERQMSLVDIFPSRSSPQS